jgi:tyrosine-protein kinase Etk/Wzc
MMLITPPQPPQGNTLQDTDLQTFVKRYMRSWPVVALCFAALIGLIVFILLTVQPKYTGLMSVLIETPMRYDDPNRMVQPKDRAESTDKNYYVNEKILITSEPVMRKVVERLGLTIQYLEKGIFDKELYKGTPLLVQVDSTRLPRPVRFPMGIPFYVSVNDENGFHLQGEGEYGLEDREIEVDKDVKWGEWFELDSVRVRVTLKPGKEKNIKGLKETTYGFMLRDVHAVTLELIANVETDLVEAEASTVNLKMTGAPNQKTVDVLNAIGHTYVERHMNERRAMLDRTIRHMEDEIASNSTSLAKSSDSVQAFRTSEGITQLNHETIMLVEHSADLEKERQELLVKDKYYDYLKNLLGGESNNNNPISPKAFGIQDQVLNDMTERLVTLQSDITLMEQEGKTANPNYQRLIRQREQQRQNVLGSVEGFTASNDLRLASVDERLARMKGQESAVPRNERTLSDKQRDQRVLEALYTDLVVRSANLRIVRSSLEPEVQVTTPAYITSQEPVFPNLKILFIVAFLLSFIIPLGILVVKGLLGGNVQSVQDVTKALHGAPVVGQIPYTGLTKPEELLEHPRSLAYAELAKLAGFVENDAAAGNHTLITGCGNVEGARTVAHMLAATLAHRGARTLLVDASLPGKKKRSLPNVTGLDVREQATVPDTEGYEHVVTLAPPTNMLATRKGLASSASRTLVVAEQHNTSLSSLEELGTAITNGQLGRLAVVMNRNMDKTLPLFGLGKGRGEKSLGLFGAIRYIWNRAA